MVLIAFSNIHTEITDNIPRIDPVSGREVDGIVSFHDLRIRNVPVSDT